jgi:geranylgeranyl diphosphate synthase type I
MAETFARASQIQTQSILRHFGDPHLSAEGISVLREIISSTGALAAVEKRIEINAGKAKEVISSSRLTVDGKSLLSELAVAATVRNV